MGVKRNKQEIAMDNIISSITTGMKQTGDKLSSKDYNLSKTLMTRVYQTLVSNEIIESNANNYYSCAKDCYSNAQELYLNIIMDEIQLIRHLTETANIPKKFVSNLFNDKFLEE